MQVLLNPLLFLIANVFAAFLIWHLARRLGKQDCWRYVRLKYLAASNIRSICIILFFITMTLMLMSTIGKSIVAYSSGYFAFPSSSVYDEGIQRFARITEFLALNTKSSLLSLSILLMLPLFRSMIMDSWELRDLITVNEHRYISLFACLRFLFPFLAFFGAWKSASVGAYLFQFLYVFENIASFLAIFILCRRFKSKFHSITESSTQAEGVLSPPFHHFAFLFPLYKYSLRLVRFLMISLFLEVLSRLTFLFMSLFSTAFVHSRFGIDIVTLLIEIGLYLNLFSIAMLIMPRKDFHIPALESDATRKFGYENLLWKPSVGLSAITVNDPFLRTENNSQSTSSQVQKKQTTNMDSVEAPNAARTSPTILPSFVIDLKTGSTLSPKEPSFKYVYESPNPWSSQSIFSYTASGFSPKEIPNRKPRLLKIDESFEDVTV